MRDILPYQDSIDGFIDHQNMFLLVKGYPRPQGPGGTAPNKGEWETLYVRLATLLL